MPIMNALAAAALLAVGAGAQFEAPAGPRDLPEFHLTAVRRRGESAFSNKDLPGHVWIADFVYTRCQGECPLLTERMRGLQKRLPKGVRLLSFTVDPVYDTPRVLRAYAKEKGADLSRWWFVAGPDENAMLPLLKDGFGTAFRKDDSAECGFRTAHSSRFALIAPDGRATLYRSDDEGEFARLEKDAAALFAAPAAARR
jgi:protein SCO1/2